MPRKRGVPKKVNHAKQLMSPRLIDKKSNRSRHASHIAQLRNVSNLTNPPVNPLYKYTSSPKQLRSPSANLFAQKLREAEAAQSAKREQEAARLADKKEFNVVQVQLAPPPVVQAASSPVVLPAAAPGTEPPALVVKQNLVRVFALAKIRQLLNVAHPGSYVAFDIDETLVMTRKIPSEILQPRGVSAFQTYVRELFPDFTTRNKHCRALQTALKDKTTVEEDTVEVLAELKARGCKMFAITARYSELAERTERVLNEMGMSFHDTHPFRVSSLQDPVTEAVMKNGIIYCNGDDKGTILARMFQQVVFSRELKQLAVNPDVDFAPPIPGFFFLDDRPEHIQSVSKSLDVLNLMRVPSVVFHYRPPVSLLMQQQANLHKTRPDVLQLEMDHFVKHGKVLSNEEALASLDNSSGDDPMADS